MCEMEENNKINFIKILKDCGVLKWKL
jgi:hypothetical protein